MKQINTTILLLATNVVFAQLTHVNDNTVLSVAKNALLYNSGSFETVGNGKADVAGNVMMVAKSEEDYLKSLSANKNIFLRLNDNVNWNSSTYGQLYVKGFSQNNITALVAKEYASNKHGDYQQLAIPFYGKEFSSLQDEFSTTLSNQRWSRQEVLRWNNKKIRFDGSVIPSATINSNSTPGISINLTDKTTLADRLSYYAVGTAGGLNPENVLLISGIPYSDGLAVELQQDNINFGSSGSATNIYREKYNTYLSDIFEFSNPWEGSFAKNVYQYANPFLTNIDLSLIGIDETSGDGNNISNIWGISVNPNSVKFNSSTGTASSYSANQIVTFDENLRPVGNIDALIIKPLGTFKIKLRDNSFQQLNFDNLRRFASVPRSEDTSYSVTAAKRSEGTSLKQLEVILLDEKNNQIGETYFVVGNLQTGEIKDELKSVQAIATPANLLSTSEETPEGGIDQNLASKYRLYINEVNESFKGKPISLSVFDGKKLKFRIRENSKLISVSLNNGESFYLKNANGAITQIKPGDEIQIDSQNYDLYYGYPDKTLDVSTTKISRTVVTLDRSLEKYVVLFDPLWKNAKVNVYDLSGKLLIHKSQVKTDTPFVIEISKDNRVLIVNVQNEDGQIINSKIIN
ncbi:hypothetical protein SAMN05660493_01501 [Epilithonimonas bovis DSM 19482]|uniref:Por secretion system C-terminal sorting domain-containing protein n=1 Tax=Epilithonimonas bovis DSM 19482 TaxID=1121284 RepID=A0A1U7PTB4_9FLAO|nr:hypothetical protein [Epilithonimonas bovis]SIT96806.1 hypothetical protein SAMN05660493_01501 [Epilithonimonas bovis DSM 19482]